MKLEPTHLRYELTDESGYRFTIYVRQVIAPDEDEELEIEPASSPGWAGHISLSAHGMKSPEAVVRRLAVAAGHFVRLSEQADDE